MGGWATDLVRCTLQARATQQTGIGGSHAAPGVRAAVRRSGAVGRRSARCVHSDTELRERAARLPGITCGVVAACLAFDWAQAVLGVRAAILSLAETIPPIAQREAP